MKFPYLSLFILVLFSCTQRDNKAFTEKEAVYESEDLIIKRLSEKTYLHTSFLQTRSFGKVPCNGLIVVDKEEAVVLDTPIDSLSSSQLLDFIETELQAKTKYIVPTHYHVDCVGGLDVFHDRGVISLSYELTRNILSESPGQIPMNTFRNDSVFTIGTQKVILKFAGEGHTVDNIVAYVPSEKVLFGGCLVKALDAPKGNLNDANVKEWPRTIEQVEAHFPNSKIIIPGHGKTGGIELLDYTKELFKE